MLRVVISVCLCIWATASPLYPDETKEEEMQIEDARPIDEIMLEARGGDQAMNGSVMMIRQEGPMNGSMLVEYDMLMEPEQYELYKRYLDVGKRKAIQSERYRWTNGIVPYTIDAGSQFSSRDKAEIQKAFDDYHRWTCIQFKERRSERQYIKIQNGAGCSSYVGVLSYFAGKGQPVNLGVGCRIRRIIAHELGHAIGFQHEQCRGDRDNYMKIHMENIDPEARYNFDKYGPDKANAFGIPYDYGSVMHYGKTFFSKNGRVTMETLDKSWQEKIGTAPNLSFADLKLANYIYKCADICPKKSCPKNAYLDKNCNCICKGPSASEPVKEC